MAAVVRVKRLIENEPLDALLINCKKRKTEASASVDLPLSAVLKFAGTVDDQVEVNDYFYHNPKNLNCFLC